MKNHVTTELSFIPVCFLWRAHLEGAPVQPIIGGRTEGPVTRVYMTNERGTARAKKKKKRKEGEKRR